MILVFGKNGQVAQALSRASDDVICLGRAEADLAIPGAAANAIATHRPRAVINAAAYTAVDQAESAPEAAHRLNATAVAEIAEACTAAHIPLVHLSTDYVFDGSGTAPRGPEAPTAPLGVYGASKLAGEDAIRASGATAVILRTAWVFSADGANFVKTMLRLAESRDNLTVVADQIGAPTPAAAIAEACLTITAQLLRDPAKAGTYHFAGTPEVSWADFARAIFATAGRQVTVTDIPTADYPTPATRPLNGRLDCHLTERTFGLPRPDWQTALAGVITELETRT